MTPRRMMQIGTELLICAVHPIPGNYTFLWTTKLSNHGGRIGSVIVPIDVALSLPMFLRLYLICRQGFVFFFYIRTNCHLLHPQFLLNIGVFVIYEQ